MVVHRTGRAQRDPGTELAECLGHQRSVRGSIVSVDLDQVPAELLEGLVVERYGTEFDVRMIASVGLAKAAWRNTEVEDAHAGNGLGRIHDGEMFAANVATTRLIHRYLNASSDIDWAGLANELVRPDRVAGARTVSDLLGELYDGWAEQSHALIETQGDFEVERGLHWVLMWNCFRALGTNWWGMPTWPPTVAAFLEQATAEPPIPKARLKQALLAAPDELATEILQWCVREGITYSRLDSA